MSDKVTLTNAQKDELIDQYVDIVVDNMSEESLILYAQEQLKSYYAKCNHYDLIEDINEYDPELYDELVDNVTNETVLDVNNNGGKF